MKVSLVVLNAGKSAGHTIPVTLSQFSIGRDPQCNLRPASPVISKRHCAVLIKEGQVFLRDYESTNGTFVNDDQIQGEVPIEHEDIVKIGPLTFKVVIDRTPVDRPTPLPSKKTFTGSENDVADMLLSMNDPNSANADVPGGSTFMEVMALPLDPESAPGPHSLRTPDTSSHQRRDLGAYAPRPQEPAAPYGQRPPEPAAPYGQRPPDPVAPYGQRPLEAPAPYGQRQPDPVLPYGQRPPDPAPYGQRPPEPPSPYGQRPPDPALPYGQQQPINGNGYPPAGPYGQPANQYPPQAPVPYGQQPPAPYGQAPQYPQRPQEPPPGYGQRPPDPNGQYAQRPPDPAYGQRPPDQYGQRPPEPPPLYPPPNPNVAYGQYPPPGYAPYQYPPNMQPPFGQAPGFAPPPPVGADPAQSVPQPVPAAVEDEVVTAEYDNDDQMTEDPAPTDQTVADQAATEETREQPAGISPEALAKLEAEKAKQGLARDAAKAILDKYTKGNRRSGGGG